MELRDWIMKIIDDLKYELAELLYPVFVHCFLELVRSSSSLLLFSLELSDTQVSEP